MIRHPLWGDALSIILAFAVALVGIWGIVCWTIPAQGASAKQKTVKAKVSRTIQRWGPPPDLHPDDCTMLETDWEELDFNDDGSITWLILDLDFSPETFRPSYNGRMYLCVDRDETTKALIARRLYLRDIA